MSASSVGLKPGQDHLAIPSFGLSIFLSILLIVTGILAILLAAETTITVVIIAAWMLMFGGVVQLVYAFRSKGVGLTIWKILVALAYFLTGLFLRLDVGIGVAALTFALVFFFLFQGVASLVAFFGESRKGGSAWVMFDGIVSILLGILIWSHWPTRALWIIGVFVGCTLLMNGTTRLMLTLAVRRTLQLAQSPS